MLTKYLLVYIEFNIRKENKILMEVTANVPQNCIYVQQKQTHSGLKLVFSE